VGNRISKALMSLAIFSTLAVPSFAGGPINVTVDGKVLNLDQPPVSTGGRVLVPLRGIFESFGATVTFDAASRGIDVHRGATAMHLTLNSNAAIVNGNNVALDVAAQAIGGRTLVPLRFVSESLGARVAWDAASNTVAIATAGAPSVSIEPAPPPTVVIEQPPAPQRPSIESVVADNAGPMGPGDVLEVVAMGTPGANAMLEIKGLTADTPMVEKSPGRYVAHFTIPALSNASPMPRPITVHLTRDGLDAVQQAPSTLALAGPEGNVFVEVTSPRKHQHVRSDFVVSGSSLPFASIEIDCSHHIHASGKADASGHFAVPVHMGFAPGKHDDIDVNVTASDQTGRLSKKQHFEIAVGD